MPSRMPPIESDTSDNTNWIPGIYNYCDRWCERCDFTSRCKSFALEIKSGAERNEEDDEELPAENDMRSKEFWVELESSMNETLEMLHRLSSSQSAEGEVLNDQQWEDQKKRDEEIEQKAGAHPIALAAWKYSDMVEEWMLEQKSMLDEKYAELETRVKLDASARRASTEADLIRDAVEVIRWYEPQIWVKLMRALTGKIAEVGEEANQDLPSDADGSAKVALIGMDRSLGAWGQLQFIFPDQTNDFITILLHLDRLRRKVEQEFTAARNFHRAGFDDLTEPDHER
jgi:hypothetical protein